MADLSSLLIVAVLAALAGFGIGWVLLVRPAAAAAAAAGTAAAEAASALQAKTDAEVLARLKVAEADAELRSAREQLLALGGVATERAQLASDLAALRATFDARDAAHAAELARLQETFVGLAGKALDAAQAKLAENAEAMLTRHREAAGQNLETNRNQLAELIQPVRETLVKYETRLGEVEKARQENYGQLAEALKQVATGQDKVSGAAARLETALRSSGKVAGRWGEEQCRNVLEAAGLSEGIDFETQWSVDGEDGRQRPDFKINLPGGRSLVIDVKCSIDAYISAAECTDPADRATWLGAHAKAVRAHADSLARKDYARAVGNAVDFVVLFVPGENFLGAALEQDRGLMNDFFKRHIVLAGPVNLVAVARTVAAMRDQARLAKEAAEIAKLGRDLYDSIRIMAGNFAAVHKALEATVGHWNKLVTQADGRVIGRARRLKELGAATGLDDLPELPQVAQVPTLPASPELAGLPAPRAGG